MTPTGVADTAAVDTAAVERLRLLATYVAGRAVDVAEAPSGAAAHTNGQVVFVSAGLPLPEQRREALLQSALLGAGSLEPELVRGLRTRPSVARRYLALEGRRALERAREQVANAPDPDQPATTTSAEESLEVARSRTRVADAPDWFGVIRPSRLLSGAGRDGAAAAGAQGLHFEIPPEALHDADAEDEDEDYEDSAYQESKILKLFESPLGGSGIGSFLAKLLGTSASDGDNSAGGESQAKSMRRASTLGSDARPIPTRIQFTDNGRPGAATGVGGALFPEWDVFSQSYRPDHCRVMDFPLTVAADVASAGVPADDVLRRKLSRVGLGPMVLRGRADGDDIDHSALIDLFVDLKSGFSSPEHVYTERRKLARNLGVLILVDASGSSVDTDRAGQAVHDHQRRAAATLAVTLEELGDRVAVYAFRSHGRHAVHLPAIKTFGQRFGALGRARLNTLQPSGFTRLGAGIRGAGEILKNQAGTPNRLLVVLSDGFPYDEGYEGKYAEADASKALEELRADGVACLCLSIGSDTGTEALARVFGSASFATGEDLSELSPRMDELFTAPLQELAAPRSTPRPAPAPAAASR